MNKLYYLTFFLVTIISHINTHAQSLVWETPNTISNATIAILPQSVFYNGENITDPTALIGVFFENNSGDFICAGYTEINQDFIDGNPIAIAAWGSEPGQDNGLEDGEEMQFYLNKNGVDYLFTDVTLDTDPMFTSSENAWASDGMYGVIEINFEGEEDENNSLESCSCIDDGVDVTIAGTYCIFNGGCSDPDDANYCYGGTYDPFVIYQNETCFTEIPGCTDALADNYDASANTDDGSCIFSGCTCPLAGNYDSIYTNDDGSCFSIVPLCIDPTAPNFDDGCDVEFTYIAGNSCEISCEIDNMSWDYSITDANMTIQISANVVTLNGNTPPIGSLIGAFYTNNDGDLTCGGYQEWEDADGDGEIDDVAVAVWGSEAGLDNGFAVGEEITWLLYVGNQTFSTNSTTMNSSPPFSETYVANGFGQILSAEYECEITGNLGCTDTDAYNYDSEATVDDGSCYNIEFDYTITDANMTIQVGITAVQLNGELGIIPNGSLLGAFFTNDDGELACGGYQEWDGNDIAVAIWGSEAGLDNGFSTNESITWILSILGQNLVEVSSLMNPNPPFSETYVANGFGQLLFSEFEGDISFVYGCIDESACNYDSSANTDDGSCIYATTWYADDDLDGLGDPNLPAVSCTEIEGFVDNSDDPCPNSNLNIITWYYDIDGDGLGSDIYSEEACYPSSTDMVDNADDPCPNDPENDSDGDGICESDEIAGCQDPTACNFNTAATDDNGTCIFPNESYLDCEGNCLSDVDGDSICDEIEIPGCQDPTACNFDATATDSNNSCDYSCYGCIDPEACNFNEQASIDDGTCDYESCSGCTEFIACNFDATATLDDGSCDYSCYGCTNEIACNFDANTTIDDGSCVVPDGICDSCDNNSIVDNDLDNDGVCDVDEITGCTDSAACNYDASPTTDEENELCIFPVGCETCSGENDGTGTIVNNDQDGDGVCNGNEILGCQDPTACNFDASATDSGNCTYPEGCDICSGENDGTGVIFDNDLDDDGVCDADEIPGCQDPTACNFDASATDSDDSCTYVDGNCDTCIDGMVIGNDEDGDGVCNADEIPGCQDPTACNFDASATDSNDCTYPEGCETCSGETNGTGTIVDNDLDNDGVCDDDEIPGCTNFLYVEYNPLATDDDGSCTILSEDGCTDSQACNYNENATDDDGSCTYLDGICDTCADGIVIENDEDGDGVCDGDEIPGCQDPTACNFNADATDSDDSCYNNDLGCGCDQPAAENGYDCFGNCLNDADTDGVCDEFEIPGCQDETACSFNASATDSDDSCTYVDGNCDTCIDGIVIENDEDGDGVCDGDEIPGCQDPTACNFDASATDSDDSCYNNDLGCGCDQPAAENGYDCFGNCLNDTDTDGVCDEFEIPGCQDETACNFNADATDSDDSCIGETTWYLDDDGDGLGYDPGAGLFSFTSCNEVEDGYANNNDDEYPGDFDNDGVYGIEFAGNDCDDNNPNIGEAETGYDCDGVCLEDVDGDGVCDQFEITGCQNPTACNFDPLATEYDGSCWYAEVYYDCDGNCLSDVDGDLVCDELEVLGCTDSEACNNNVDATDTDNNLCVYAQEWYDCDGNCLSDVDGDLVCDELEVLGCTDSEACNFDPQATDEDQSCEYLVGICDTCEEGVVIDNDTDNDGVCNEDEIPGCTDSEACNFDASLGCTDDDGSCYYSEITVETSTTPTSCETSLCDGTISLTINNAQPPYTVEYYFASEETTIVTGGDLVNGCAGLYVVTVTDLLGCSEEFIVTINTALNDQDGDGVCDQFEVIGCQDETACNYSSEATENIGCEYCSSNLGDVDGNGLNDCELINYAAVQSGEPIVFDCEGCINDSDFDGVCDELEEIGCTNINACNYIDEFADSCEDVNLDGIPDCCVFAEAEYVDCDGLCLNDSDGDGVCDEIEYLGCTDPAACNYNTEATENDSSCLYCYSDLGDVNLDGIDDCEAINEENGFGVYGCNGCVNDQDGDGVCDEVEIVGCQEGSACNFNPDATDSGECFYLEFITILTQNIQNISCAGANDGAFVLNIEGGTAPYNAILDGNQCGSINIIDNVVNFQFCEGGSFDVYVTDNNGCELLQTIDIEEPEEIEISIDYLNYISCIGESDGALTSSIQGGVPPYISTTWSNLDGDIISTTQDVEGLSAGAYLLDVVDNSGCSQQTTFIIGEPNEMDVTPFVNNANCFEESNGTFEFSATGGTGPYTLVELLTFPEEEAANPEALSAGVYQFTIADIYGCTFVDQFVVEEDVEELTINIETTNPTEFCEDESATITTPNLFDTYIWSEVNTGVIYGEGDSSLTVNQSGLYYLNAITDDGCEASSDTIAVTVYDNPVFGIGGPTNVYPGTPYTYYTMNNENYDMTWALEDGEYGSIIGDNTNSAIQITWNLDDSNEEITFLSLTQIDEFGCTHTETIDIVINWPINLSEHTDNIELNVYPNPFSAYTTVNISNNIDPYDLYLYDSKGGLVDSYIKRHNKSIRIDNNLPKGVYHLEFISGSVNKREILIVQ